MTRNRIKAARIATAGIAMVIGFAARDLLANTLPINPIKASLMATDGHQPLDALSTPNSIFSSNSILFTIPTSASLLEAEAPADPSPDSNLPVNLPEPATLFLAGSGIFGLAAGVRRRFSARPSDPQTARS